MAALGVRLVYLAGLPVGTELAQRGFSPAAAEDYTAHRLGLGIGDTAEIGGEACYPLEANFEVLHGVDFKKGCYVGQELTARMKLKGQLRKRILPVTGSAPLPQPGTPVTMPDGKELGPLIAICGTQGLALLRLDHLEGAQEGTFHAQEVPLRIHWPSWLPR
jgi:folate-binding protein YgfZ